MIRIKLLKDGFLLCRVYPCNSMWDELFNYLYDLQLLQGAESTEILKVIGKHLLWVVFHRFFEHGCLCDQPFVFEQLFCWRPIFTLVLQERIEEVFGALWALFQRSCVKLTGNNFFTERINVVGNMEGELVRKQSESHYSDRPYVTSLLIGLILDNFGCHVHERSCLFFHVPRSELTGVTKVN
jgi:hypothetical protein